MLQSEGLDDLLEDLPDERRETSDPHVHVASLFLAEPHYAAAGNHYALGRWIEAVNLDADLDRIHELHHRLVSGTWQPFFIVEQNKEHGGDRFERQVLLVDRSR